MFSALMVTPAKQGGVYEVAVAVAQRLERTGRWRVTIAGQAERLSDRLWPRGLEATSLASAYDAVVYHGRSLALAPRLRHLSRVHVAYWHGTEVGMLRAIFGALPHLRVDDALKAVGITTVDWLGVRRGLACCSASIVVGADVAREVRRLTSAPVLELPNYALVEGGAQGRCSDRSNPGALKLVVVGGIGWRKGVRFLSKALNRARDRVDVTIVGYPDESQKRLANGCTITTLRWVPEEHVTEVLQTQDVFVMCSIYEGMSLSLIRAVELGMPCIVPGVNGVRDLIGPENGWIYRVGDVDGFVNAVATANRRRTELTAMGAAGREELLRKRAVAPTVEHVVEALMSRAQ